MRITVRARPGAKSPYVRRLEESLFGGKESREFIVGVKEPAQGGKANRAIEKMLAGFFRVPPSRVRIVAGHTSRVKVVEIG